MKLKNIQEKGIISIDDNLTFHRIIDVLNDLFNKGYKGTGRGTFPFGNDGKYLWFPKLNETNKKYKPNPAKYGHVIAACWSNILSFDGTTITQKWIATDYLPPWGPIDKTKKEKIVDIGVFAKEIRGEYRFVGIFHYDHANSHDYTTIYKRYSKELPFIEWRK